MKLITTALLASLSVSIACAKEYVLYKKGFVAPVGTVVESKTESVFKDMKMKMSAQGMQMDGTMSQSSTKIENLTVISPTVVEYTFISNKEEASMVMNGQENKMPGKPKPLEGKPLIFELKAGEWNVRAKGDPLSEVDKIEAKKLISPITNSGIYYGAKSREVGETWLATEEGVKELLGDSKITKSDIKLTIKEILEKDGLKCAKIEMLIDVEGIQKDSGMTLGMKGSAEVYRSLKYLTDIEVKADVTMLASGKAGAGASMNMSGAGTILETNSVKAK